MSTGKLALAAVLSLGLALLLCSAVAAQDGPPPIAEDPPPPPPGAGPDVDAPGPFGPRQGRGGPARGLRAPQGRGGGPPAMGGPKGMGRGDQRGPHGPKHFGGPPRWPFHDWEGFEQRDPEMFELLKSDSDMERQARELAVQYRRAPSKQRDEIKKRLAELIDDHFEVRQQRRLLELKRLEEELKRLREAVAQRSEAREAIVGKRVSELVGEKPLDF